MDHECSWYLLLHHLLQFLPTALTLLREFSMTSLDGLRLLPSIVSVIQSTEILTVDLVRQIQRNVVALAIGSASYEVVFSETERMILRSLGSSLENDDVPDQDSVRYGTHRCGLTNDSRAELGCNSFNSPSICVFVFRQCSC